MTTYLQPIIVNEKKKNAEKLINQLDAIPLTRMYEASFKAVVRLHLFFTGRTHELFLGFSDKAQAIILREAGADGLLDGVEGYRAQSAIAKAWGDTFTKWSDELQKARVEAGSIPFGVMAVFHERLVIPEVENQLQERVTDGVFSPQLEVLLNSSSNYLYGDSLNLSQRIWRIDRDARAGMNSVLMNGIANGSSAWDIASQLEQYLGANGDCPRWTSTRLYQKTKGQIASGDTGGLLTGNACDGRGVSYNALRLARTEIQKMHSLATDKVMAAQPWVEKEKIRLSAAHPEEDICDETVSGGEDGQGVYPVGEIELPLHPNCLCYKTAVLMDQKAFTDQLRGWMDGSQDWSAMDDYADMLNGEVKSSILKNAVNLAVWLFGDNLEKWIA